MRNYRAVAGGVIVCGYLFASGMFAGGAAAQSVSAEPVGQPMQLLQLLRIGGNSNAGKTEAKKSDVRRRARLAARPVAKSSSRHARFAARTRMSAAKTRMALRHRTRPHVMVAEQQQQQQQPQAQPQPAPQVAPPTAQVASAPAAAGPASAPTAMTVDAATLTPAPQIVAPVTAPVPSELVVDGQTVEVASADEANEIDLAANDASVAASDAALGAMTAPDAATTETTGAAANSTAVAALQAQGAEIGSTSWLLQAMAALGGAVAAGSVAWFLIGSAPQRMYG